MLKYVINVALAVILGIIVMLTPLVMLNYNVGSADSGQPPRGETKEVFTSSEEMSVSNITSEAAALKGREGILSRFASSLPYAVLIVAAGFIAAITVLIISKRRL